MIRWQYIVALLLALTLGMHQLVMASPSHSQVMAMGMFTASPSPSLFESMPDGSSGNDAAIPHSHGIDTCAVEEAVLHHLPAPLPLPLVFGLLPLIALLAVFATPNAARSRAAIPWLWPPARRRALLQVFLR